MPLRNALASFYWFPFCVQTIKLNDAADIDMQPAPNPKAIDYTPVFISRHKQRENKIVICTWRLRSMMPLN